MIGPADYFITPDRLTTDMGQRWQVIAAGDVDGTPWSAEFTTNDEDQHPTLTRVSVELAAIRRPMGAVSFDVALASDDPVRALLDSRQHVDVFVSAWYDQHSVGPSFGVFKLDTVTANDDGSVTVTAASYEVTVIDAGRYPDGVTIGPLSAAAALDALALLATGSVGVANPEALTGATVTLEGVTDTWDAMASTADANGWRVYGPGRDTGSQLEVRAAPRGDEPAVHQLVTGVAGTVVDRDRTSSREQYANHVDVVHEWRDSGSVDQRVVGSATHPFGAVDRNRRAVQLDRPGSITQARANAEATAMVARLVDRGTVYRVTAINAFWLRPDMVIEVEDPDTLELARAHVDTITFTDAGVMTLTTRAATDPWTITDADTASTSITDALADFPTIRDATWGPNV